MLEQESCRPLLDGVQQYIKAHRARALNPAHPSHRGSAQSHEVLMQAWEGTNRFYQVSVCRVCQQPEEPPEFMQSRSEAAGKGMLDAALRSSTVRGTHGALCTGRPVIQPAINSLQMIDQQPARQVCSRFRGPLFLAATYLLYVGCTGHCATDHGCCGSTDRSPAPAL